MEHSYRILSEQYDLIRKSQLFNEQVHSLEQILQDITQEIKLNEGIAGLGTRMKDKLSGAASQAGAMMKNVGAMSKGVTQGEIGDLTDPQAASRQKKINNVIGRFNRDINALVPDLASQHPELNDVIGQLNQTAQQPSPTAGTPPQAAAPVEPQSTENQPVQQSTATNKPVQQPATTDDETVVTTTKTTDNGSDKPVKDKKEGLLKRAIKTPGRAIGALSRKAQDLQARTAQDGIEALLPGFGDKSDSKNGNKTREAGKKAATTTTTQTVKPQQVTRTTQPQAAPAQEQPAPVEQPQATNTQEQPTPVEQQTFETGEEVLVRTKTNPRGITGTVKEINPNGSIRVATKDNPSGYAFNSKNIMKTPRISNQLNENVLGGVGFMSKRWGNFS